MLLSDDQLKVWLQKDGLQRIDKILLVLSVFEKPTGVTEIKAKARSLGCNIDKWNVSDILARGKGMSLQMLGGHEIAEKGKARLQSIGLDSASPAATQVALDLRKHLVNVKDTDTRSFVEEAIKCYEARLFRSAIVMAWLAAVDVLKKEVVANHLAAFNAEARKVNLKWKDAKNADEIGAMNEGDFLNRIMGISMIGKNRKQRLEQALTLRNGCGHPNSLKVGQNEAAAHVEALLQNVFEVFNPGS
ncbi:hypothetical protein HF680_02725 [Brevundimonas sp. WCHBH090558]|uniref:hypothetical protein n=1 Tax=Brevundimonas huaxiensis TaxID=2725493 RepID=UPI00162978C4|nr:hypothetical protein [Brevundimonas huaxiensis]MBC1181574.1 hypothetical protein [Brevundimonas huaxiensis]